jgi:hypothetical protein
MTRRSQKDEERFFAERAAEALHESWCLLSGETPDFIVKADQLSFGLEVSQVVTGPRGVFGSLMMMNEGHIRRTIDKLRREYETHEGITLNVGFSGNSFGDLSRIVPALIEADFGSREIGDQVAVSVGQGLHAWVMRAFHPEWYRLEDRVGLVDQDPATRLQETIHEKAGKLPMYQAAAGKDVRLLLVANRLRNSGKMILRDISSMNLAGFSAVYFYSYPDSIVVLEEDAGIVSRPVWE